MKKMINKKAAVMTTALAGIILLTASSCEPSSSAKQQQITEDFAKTLSSAQPYPLAQMKNSAERANVQEKLLRMNNPNKIGYVTTMTQNGQIIASYTIKGKVSSTQSQLTNTNYHIGSSGAVVDSMGDDGSFGENEGGSNGIFFFTTDGVMISWNGLWVYSDAPLNLTTQPLITMDIGAKPSSTAGQK